MTFWFDPSLFNDPDFVPAIYHYNPNNQLFERIKNQTIDKTNGNVTITVTYFEIYILLDKTKVDHYWLSESSTFFSDSACYS